MQTFASDPALLLVVIIAYALFGWALSRVCRLIAQGRRRSSDEVPPVRECKLHYCPDCEQIYTCPADACRMPYLCRHADAGLECVPIGAETSVPVAGG